MTEEEAGREVRRFAFLRQMELWGGTKIALAHHRNDNVETLIFHLCRGTGLAGLAGIAPADGPWIHPLLCVDRKEIESYLENGEYLIVQMRPIWTSAIREIESGRRFCLIWNNILTARVYSIWHAQWKK